MRNLHFEISTYRIEEKSPNFIPIPEHYDYWVPLVTRFLDKSDTIEIHCWDKEVCTIEETKNITDQFNISHEFNLTYFKTLITPKVKQNLLHENLTEFGELKWFSIFLSNGSNPVLNIEHWGTELFAPNVNDQEVAYIKSIMPTDTNFNIF